ncbi:hypothetical protein [Herbaspirillum sp. NPDC101396]|uniref:hypothetical protein n=1 Tax=Herbaspirillum sp. NPDC101396 TaxID=3364005 RepID=UPI00383BD5F5
MPFFNIQTGIYNCGDQQPGEIEVPVRPAPDFRWNGAAWIAALAPVPQTVTPLQARRALLAVGKLDAVNAAVAAGSVETQLAWEFAASVERGSQFVALLAAAVGLSDVDVDNLFRSAATFV